MSLSNSEIATQHATRSGIEGGIFGGVISASAVLLANKYSTRFRTSLGPSGKAALVTMASLAAFNVQAENTLLHAARNPHLYKENHIQLTEQEENHQPSQLQFHHHLANAVYDHPFRAITVCGAPLVAGLFYQQSQNAGIKLSQQIMHTRIYGQGSIVVLLLASMAFHDWMERRGRFE